MKINEEWKVCYSQPMALLSIILTQESQKKVEREASKIRTEFEKKESRYEQYADKLERRAGARFHPRDDGM